MSSGASGDTRTVGRSERADICIADEQVSSLHLDVRGGPGSLQIRDRGSTNGTRIGGPGGQRVGREWVSVSDDAMLYLGTCAFPAALLLQRRAQRAPSDKREFEPSPLSTIWRVGRSADSHIRLPFPQVSARHLEVTGRPGALRVRDLGSRNGTFIGHRSGVRVGESWREVPTDGVLYLGNHRLPVSLLVDGIRQAEAAEAESGVQIKTGVGLTIGSDTGCEIAVPSGEVSRKVRIVRDVEGVRVGDRVVRQGGVLHLAHHTVRVGKEGRVQVEPIFGQIDLRVEGLGRCVADRRTGAAKWLLQDVSFSIYSSEVACIMGPSGAGKSTLLRALTGDAPADSGRVVVNGSDLHRDFEKFRGLIGYVPQDDLVHADLTVERSLYYAARMRLPDSVSDDELHRRVSSVLQSLDLTGQRNLRIGSPSEQILSGGQRKRVNIGVELVTDPLILIADEPTSGLSSRDTAEVVGVFRRIADKGRPVLMTIHQPSVRLYASFDLAMVLGRGGRLAWFGPPDPESYEWFKSVEAGPEGVLEALEERLPEDWAQRYQQSEVCRKWVTERCDREAPPPETLERPRPSPWVQLAALVGRLATVKLTPGSLRRYGLPPIVICGLLLMAYFDIGDKGASKRATPMLFLVMSSLFFGLFNCAQEVVAERPIYRRERMVGLGIPVYLLSKVLVLGAISVAQVAVLVLPVTAVLGFAADVGAVFLVCALTSIIAAAMGLALSCIVSTPTGALNFVPILVVAQLMLSGFFIEPGRDSDGHVMDKRVTMLVLEAPTTVRWAAEAVFNQEHRRLSGDEQRAWESFPMEARQYRVGGTGRSLAIMGAQALFFLLLAAATLRHQDPPVLRRRL